MSNPGGDVCDYLRLSFRGSVIILTRIFVGCLFIYHMLFNESHIRKTLREWRLKKINILVEMIHASSNNNIRDIKKTTTSIKDGNLDSDGSNSIRIWRCLHEEKIDANMKMFDFNQYIKETKIPAPHFRTLK